MDNNTNDYLALGVSILIVGLMLGNYSYSTYSETKKLSEQIDFTLIDDNNDISTTDKYYKYLSIADFLNQKLTKNKDILIKNTSCVYLDYAQHNAIELYRLTKKMDFDESKIGVAAGNIRGLYNMLEYYTTCKKTEEYKSELQNILNEIQKTEINRLNSEERMNEFLNGYRDKHTKQAQENTAAIAPDNSVQTEEQPQAEQATNIQQPEFQQSENPQ